MEQYGEEAVAILLATYNGEKYIERQIQSLKDQTYRKFVCYIHDDGSSDCTADIIQQIVADDNRFRIIDGKPTGGAKRNFLFLLGLAEEKYILFCDQDDVWLPNKVEDELWQIRQLEAEHGDIPIAVFCNLKIVSHDGNEISPDFMKYSGFNTQNLSYQSLLIGNVAPGCAMIINKALRDIAVSYQNIDDIEMHDWWCISIAALQGIVYFLDIGLILYSQHNKQVVGTVMKSTAFDRIRYDLKALLHGELNQDKKEWGNIIFRQTGELVQTMKPDNTITAELNQLIAIKKKNRIRKLLYFLCSQWGSRKQRLWLGLWY